MHNTFQYILSLLSALISHHSLFIILSTMFFFSSLRFIFHRLQLLRSQIYVNFDGGTKHFFGIAYTHNVTAYVIQLLFSKG